jgi:hypothetical protein
LADYTSTNPRHGSINVIASEAKQSIASTRKKAGLLRRCRLERSLGSERSSILRDACFASSSG